jgi:hypothetical protein
MSDWVVTVANRKSKATFKYWVEAQTEDDAKARGFRLHGASENAKNDGSDVVAEAKAVE